MEPFLKVSSKLAEKVEFGTNGFNFKSKSVTLGLNWESPTEVAGSHEAGPTSQDAETPSYYGLNPFCTDIFRHLCNLGVEPRFKT
jgi:hypothetical protein